MKKHRKSYIRYFFIFFLIFIFLFFINKIIHPTVLSAIKYKIEEQTLKAINSSILSTLENEKDMINNSVKINYSDDNKITSIIADNYIFNYLKERIYTDISNSLKVSNFTVKIPLGAFIGIPLFSAYGPEIPVKIKTASIPKSNIYGTLKTTGINQNIYTVILTYSVEVSSIIPLCSINTEVSNSFVLTEIVFSGDIPQIALNQ